MRFRLIYDGSLRATQRDKEQNQKNPLAKHKHEIRKKFHEQLMRLWETNKFLSKEMVTVNPDHVSTNVSNSYQSVMDEVHGYAPMKDVISLKYQKYGYKFIPLVRESASVLCYLNILFLRRDIPGSLITAGDIDNRIKTVIDALRIPQSEQELGGYDKAEPLEEPFYCLLEDDKNVTQLSVETDELLLPLTEKEDSHQLVRLIITVELRPYHVTMDNLGFV